MVETAAQQHGTLDGRLAGGAGVGKIFWDIPERATRDEVQEGFRKALRDPSLQLAYWYPEGGHYVDVAGERFDLPDESSRTAVTRLEYADEPVAALVHDAALRDEPELLNAVAGAARIALERDRLLVEVRARASRYRALLEAMPDLMFRISLEGRYVGYNAPNERDLISRDVVGRTLWERLPEELADRIMAAGRRALADQMTQRAIADLKSKAIASGRMHRPIEVDVNATQTVARITIRSPARARTQRRTRPCAHSGRTSCRQRSVRCRAPRMRSPGRPRPPQTRTR